VNTEGLDRILFVSSSGGVLLDLLALAPWCSKYRVTWAVVEGADTASALAGQRCYWIGNTSFKRPFRIVLDFVSAWRILRRERPQLIVSAGSGPAISFFAVARLLGIPTFWIYTLNILGTPGVSARICTRLSSRVFLQQKSMLSVHPEGIVIGELY
jgi:UDP-N-acetylglucosamine:LPS N-acetylglucosamine transferase